jgi:hypothetical protein
MPQAAISEAALSTQQTTTNMPHSATMQPSFVHQKSSPPWTIAFTGSTQKHCSGPRQHEAIHHCRCLPSLLLLSLLLLLPLLLR